MAEALIVAMQAGIFAMMGWQVRLLHDACKRLELHEYQIGQLQRKMKYQAKAG